MLCLVFVTFLCCDERNFTLGSYKDQNVSTNTLLKGEKRI